MIKENITVVVISWEKIPFDFSLIKQKTASCDYGIYQVYGHHPAYGDDALLYIGEAKDQTFGVRIDNRWEFIESTARPTHVRLGRISIHMHENGINCDIKRWKELIRTCEKILIKTHTPALNKQDIGGVFSGEMNEFNNEHFLVINTEDYGRLLPEVSTLRMSYRFWNYEKPITWEQYELAKASSELAVTNTKYE